MTATFVALLKPKGFSAVRSRLSENQTSVRSAVQSYSRFQGSLSLPVFSVLLALALALKIAFGQS